MGVITPIVMPKWGLSMTQGTVASWLVTEGTRIQVGMPILDVETDKIANQVEAPDPGLLRRIVAAEGSLLPVKALLGVMAEENVDDAEIDAYIAEFVTPSVEEDAEAGAPIYQFIDMDGIRIRYARRGAATGTPVVFIHGYGGDLDNWLFNLDAIGEKSPVVALDLPGHGQSSIKLPGSTIAALAQFTARFLTSIDVDRAHVVGHSMGGAIASQLLLDVPQRIASLTLIDSAGFGQEINGAYINGFAQATGRRDLKPVLELLFADGGLVSRQMIDDVLKYKRLDGVASLLGELNRSLFADGHQIALPGLELARSGSRRAPVLMIWGRDDRVIPAAHTAHAPAGASVEVLDATGHMAQMERASEVNRLIRRHIGV